MMILLQQVTEGQWIQKVHACASSKECGPKKWTARDHARLARDK